MKGFEGLPLPVDSEIEIIDNILIVKKWNWDFEKSLNFQKEAQAYIAKNRQKKIYIFCNHPHCFTLGRGNERGNDELVDFSPLTELKFKVHKIHRGGGITYHYPGQFIFYPILSVSEKYSLEDHMCWLLKSVANVLKSEYELADVMATKKLMGVWHKRKKLASIGVGLNRFVTEHGLALNLIYDEKMFLEILKINPCGLDSQVYTSLNKIKSDISENILEEFFKKYLRSTILN